VTSGDPHARRNREAPEGCKRRPMQCATWAHQASGHRVLTSTPRPPSAPGHCPPRRRCPRMRCQRAMTRAAATTTKTRTTCRTPSAPSRRRSAGACRRSAGHARRASGSPRLYRRSGWSCRLFAARPRAAPARRAPAGRAWRAGRAPRCNARSAWRPGGRRGRAPCSAAQARILALNSCGLRVLLMQGQARPRHALWSRGAE